MKIAIRIFVVLALVVAAWAVIQDRRTASLNNRAVQLLNEEKYQEALPLLEKARSRGGENLPLLRNLARTYDNLGREQDALVNYRAILRMDPGDGDARRRVEEIEDDYSVRQRAAERVARMKAEGLTEDVATTAETVAQARALLGLGDPSGALLLYKRALLKDPENVEIERMIETIEHKLIEDASNTQGEAKP